MFAIIKCQCMLVFVFEKFKSVGFRKSLLDPFLPTTPLFRTAQFWFHCSSCVVFLLPFSNQSTFNMPFSSDIFLDNSSVPSLLPSLHFAFYTVMCFVLVLQVRLLYLPLVANLFVSRSLSFLQTTFLIMPPQHRYYHHFT